MTNLKKKTTFLKKKKFLLKALKKFSYKKQKNKETAQIH